MTTDFYAQKYGEVPEEVDAAPENPFANDADTLPGPIEVRPGVTYDPSIAATKEPETVFGMTVPSSEAYSDTEYVESGELTPIGKAAKFLDDIPTVSKALSPVFSSLPTAIGETAKAFGTDVFKEKVPVNRQAFIDARNLRMSKEAENYQTNFNAEGEEVSSLINEKAALGQSKLYLADNDEQYLNALESVFGDGNVRMIKDKGPSVSMFDAQNYVSIRRDDDTFTDFEPVSSGFTDYARRIAPGLVAEVAASTAILGPAFAAGTMGGSVPFVGVVLGPALFTYTLYVGGKGVETGRQYLQDELGLNDEQVVEFESFADAAQQIAKFRPDQAGFDTPEAQREAAASLEAVFAGLPGLKAGLRLMTSKFKSKGTLTPRTYDSARSALDTKRATEAGGDLDIGVPIEGLTLPQMTPNRIIMRLASLAEQTSTLIPEKMQRQAQSLVTYLKKYGDNIGEGNFKAFQEARANLAQTLETVKKGNPTVTKNLSEIGENLGTSEDLFLRLRAIESRGRYTNIFDSLGNASYDLADIRKLLPGKKTILPTTPDKKVEGVLPTEAVGEKLIDNIVGDLLALGREQANGALILTPAQVRAAAKDFAEKNPDYAIDVASIDTPAKILQLYATRLGQMASERFGEFGTTPSKQLLGQAMSIRNALLDKIGNPRETLDNIVEIRKNLTEANDFYRETIKKSSQKLQVQARQGRRSDVGDEPAFLPETIGTTPSALGRTAPASATLEHIAEQESYIRTFLNDPDNIDLLVKSDSLGDMVDKGAPALQQLRQYFMNTFSHHLSRSMGTDAADVTDIPSVIKYLDSFETKQLRALGIDEATEATIRNDATYVANVLKTGITQTIVDLPAGQAKVADIFEKVLKGDSADVNMQLNELMMPIRRMGKDEAAQATLEMRAGLLNHIFSVDKGIIKTVTSNSAYGEAGQLVVDADKFYKLMTQLKRAKIFDGPNAILSAQDEKVLDAMVEYAGVINRQGGDVGSALAGAQIIGEMFTLDPAKFLSGVGRLASQGRIARLFTNDEFVQAATRTSAPMSPQEKLKLMFFGKTAFGSLVARVAMEDGRENDAEQTARMLQDSSMDYYSLRYNSN